MDYKEELLNLLNQTVLSKSKQDRILELSPKVELETYVPYGDIQKNWAKVKYALKSRDYLLSLIN